MSSCYYFDENATATPYKPALQAMYDCLQLGAINASSVHQQGRKGRGIIERCRRSVASSLSVNPRHLTFCSGATEALHTVIASFASTQGHMVVSAVEHPAVWGALDHYHVNYTKVYPDALGCINPLDIEHAIQDDTVLVIMMYAQNEIGVIYPISQIAKRIGSIPLLVDAVQAWGKVPINLDHLGATFAVFSGHKIGAAQGSGVIWSRGGQSFQPLLHGGAQERGRRAGTENVASLASLSVAATAVKERIVKMPALSILRDRLQNFIAQEIADSIIHAHLDHISHSTHTYQSLHQRLANTLSVSFKGVAGDLLLQSLDLRGICLSSGSACSSGALEASATLLALGIPLEIAQNTIRISLSPDHTEHDIMYLAEILKEEVNALRRTIT